MKRTGFALVVLLLLTACALSGAAREAPVVEPSATLDRDDPLVQDAAMYAEDQGVTLEEAVRRLQLMQSMGDLQPRLQELYPETFAGLWIEHEPEFKMVVQFTEEPGEAFESLVAGEPYADLIEVQLASRPQNSLEVDLQSAVEALRAVGIPVSGGIDLQQNRAEIYVVGPAEPFEALLEAEGVALPESVVVVEQEEGQAPETYRGQGKTFEGPSGQPLYFPLQPPALASMLALLEGTLVEEGGCLRIAPDYGGASFLVLWPYDHDLRVAESIEVLNGEGVVVARVGEALSMGGGAMESSSAMAHYDEVIPGLSLASCSGPYWVAGEIVP